MIVKNGLVFGEKGYFEKRDLLIKNGRIADSIEDRSGGIDREIEERNGRIFGEAEAEDGIGEVIDADGMYVIPGLVDIHIHGAMGHDFCDADVHGLKKIAEYEKRNGIAAFCPTTMSYPEKRLADIVRTIGAYIEELSCDGMRHPSCGGMMEPDSDNMRNREGTFVRRGSVKNTDMARIIGINMEGPFLSEEKKAAQKGDYLQNPDIEMFKRLSHACDDNIKLVTIAPELTGADEFIEEASKYARVSLGHSGADYETAKRAFHIGADHVTHLFNAMGIFHHRNPGIIGAALDEPNVFVEVICDACHVHPSVVRSIYRMFGSDRVILISDSMRAAGMPDGEYELGGQTVIKKGSHARLRDGTLAGSVTNLFCCFKNAVEFGIPLEAAVKMATVNPAKSIGVESSMGVIKPGAYSDILILDKKLDIVKNLCYL